MTMADFRMSTDQFFVRPKLAHFLAIFKCKGQEAAGRGQQAAGRDLKLSFGLPPCGPVPGFQIRIVSCTPCFMPHA
jgi:hypothetical protein